MNILDCGHPASEHSEHFTGYGEDKDGKKFCYDCCAEQEKEYMRTHNKTTLYFSGEQGNRKVGDWTGKFEIKPNKVRKGRHNIAGNRYDVWFVFEGQNWHGVTYGDMTQICHCQKIK